ncbi:RCC1 domain-containing protein [Actinoplanes sp. GCM10030250]|uniref:RCC1 domain-containing protein n=1 Tax=Actinoplanes sp. GCM10030250 TaxID=3273376 RepID=UPI00361C0B7F
MLTSTVAMAGTLTILAAMAAGPAGPQRTDGSAARLVAGNSHTCQLDGNGKAYCWGEGDHGRLGNGSVVSQTRPTAVEAPAGVTLTQLAAGGSHTCGLGNDTKSYCWGRGYKGQLGNSGVADQARPVAVRAPAGVVFTQLVAGDEHTCGLAGDSRAYCWGDGDYGQLGNADLVRQMTPEVVNAPAGVTFTRLAAGGVHTCGLGADTKAYCWGNGVYGQLGNGGTVGQLSPVAVDAPAGVIFTELAVGRFHTCGLAGDHQAYCWGEEGSGALGDGGTDDRSRPVAVSAPAGVSFIQLAAGNGHTCGLGSDTRAYCWGSGGSGALGDGGTDDRSRPVAVQAPAGVAFTQLAAGEDHTCGLTGAAKVYCWGAGRSGALGDGGTADRSRPVAVAAPAA